MQINGSTKSEILDYAKENMADIISLMKNRIANQNHRLAIWIGNNSIVTEFRGMDSIAGNSNNAIQLNVGEAKKETVENAINKAFSHD